MEKDDNLPDHISYSKFVKARLKELKFIENELGQCSHGSRAYQKLPRHMQRRAVSTNPKRLPKKLREKNRKEVGEKKESKRPSRKYRRRPSKLVTEHNKRSINNHWLETHIWHAKRFHMKKMWGHAIPQSPTYKAYRTTLRAARHLCLVQDISYESCLEVHGSKETVLEGLKPFLSEEDFVIFRNNSSTDLSWGWIFLYQRNKYPLGAIGRLQFMWHPSDGVEPIRKLWFWCHPSIYDDTVAVLQEVFDQNMSVDSSESVSTFKNLKGKLNKFLLTGPDAYKVLTRILRPTNIEPERIPKYWWTNMDRNGIISQRFCAMKFDSFQHVTPSEKTYVGHIVRDTRSINSVTVRTYHSAQGLPCKVVRDNKPAKLYLPILDPSVRETFSANLCPLKAIDDLRSEYVVPGSDLPIVSFESRVPVLILFEPPSKFSEPSWTLILPPKIGNGTWISLNLNGGIPGGFAQRSVLEQEFLLSPSPHECPDTTAGRKYATEVAIEAKSKFFKKPPNVRFNFIKLGIRNPFSPDWLELIKSLSPQMTDFCVLRDRKTLEILNKVTWSSETDEVLENPSKKRKVGEGFPDCPITASLDVIPPENSLVYVRLVIYDKGSCEDNALICLPTDEDLRKRSELSKDTIDEPIHKDEHSHEREKLKETHQKQKRRKRRLTKVHKAYIEKQIAANPEESQKLKEVAAPKIVDMSSEYEAYNPKMEDLWLPDPATPFQNNSRTIIGYVTHGTFLNGIGRCGGLGWIASKPLLNQLVKVKLLSPWNITSDDDDETAFPSKRLMLLVRNPSSRTYRWARIFVPNL